MNSLGIPKSPDERAILIKNLMHSTNSTTKEELINWLQKKWIEF
jgi:arginine repressor